MEKIQEAMEIQNNDSDPYGLGPIMAAFVCGDPVPEGATSEAEAFKGGVLWAFERPWLVPGVMHIGSAPE